MANRPARSGSEDERDAMDDDDVRGLADDEDEEMDDEFEDEDEFSDENEDEQ